MKKQKRPYYQNLFYTLLLLEALCILFVILKSPTTLGFFNENLFSLNDNWILHADNGNLQSVTLPVKLNTGSDDTVIISQKLPDNIEHITTLSILTSHQSIIASIEGNVIYSRVNQENDHQLFNVPLGSVWDIIPLGEDWGGKTLTLVFSSKFPEYAGRINEIHVGTESSILLHAIDHFSIDFLLSFIICLMGSFIIFLYMFIKRLLRADKSLYYLGWFSLISGIWLLMESNLAPLFFRNSYMVSALGYLALMTFTIPLLLYINLLPNYHYKKQNTFSIYILLANNFLMILLQITNIYDFHTMLYVIRGLLFVILFVVMITLILDITKHKNKEVRIFTIAAFILCIFSIIEFIMYSFQTNRVTGQYFRIGFYLFLLILAWDGIRKIVDFIKLSERATHYRQLAYRDPLTNCRNRVAYELDIEKIDTHKNTTIFMADMNNMKEINDTYGHQIGDEVIILCSQCLLKVFGRSVYRIGGDEFLCIEYDLTQENINQMISAFHEECKRANEDIPYKFILSIGYATFDPSMDKTIQNTIKRADINMYEAKEKAKNANSLFDSI